MSLSHRAKGIDMNLENLNKWSTLITNIAVLASLVFLGYELNQNNENLEAQSRYTIKENRASMNSLIAHDPAFAGILLKATSGSEFSPSEEIQLNSFFRSNLANWEWDHGEYLRGRLDLNLNLYKGFVDAFPQIENLWNSTKSSYREEFQQFMDIEILSD